MSKYQFCLGCEHMKTTKVHGFFSTKNNPIMVDQISCPARFNPYEPMKDPTDHTKVNPHGCPRNEKFMEMEDKKKEAVRGSNR